MDINGYEWIFSTCPFWNLQFVVSGYSWIFHSYPLISSHVSGIPSGKLSHNYGKPPFFMGKSTMSMAIFNSKLLVYQRVSPKFGID